MISNGRANLERMITALNRLILRICSRLPRTSPPSGSATPRSPPDSGPQLLLDCLCLFLAWIRGLPTAHGRDPVQERKGGFPGVLPSSSFFPLAIPSLPYSLSQPYEAAVQLDRISHHRPAEGQNGYRSG